MCSKEKVSFSLLLRYLHGTVFLIGALMLHSQVGAVTLSVMGSDGAAVTGYRWVVEEDLTYHGDPGVPDPVNTLAVNFHRSYMPVVAQGTSADLGEVAALDPNKHYFISVLPYTGYAIGGAAVAPGQAAAAVTVNKLPLPTAQITVFVFQDNRPLNNAPDLPEEEATSQGMPMDGFQIEVTDAAGRYGIAGGQQMMDAFGNMLGTTYSRDPVTGEYLLDAAGSPIVEQMGDGIVLTDADGYAVVKNLAPGKYGVQIIPPTGEGWVQTSTIEGTKTIDAWVKANEPPYFREFGPPGQHVFVGFVKETNLIPGGGASAITGRVVNLHLSRPPNYAFNPGGAFGPAAEFGYTTAWVALNDLGVGGGEAIYVAPCDVDGSFAIPAVPPGNYQLVIWDRFLDNIIAFLGVTVDGAGNCNGGNCALGDVPVFSWFARLDVSVFNDLNANGFREAGEGPIGEPSNVSLRFRDGTIYQNFPTDSGGFAPFDTVFPFFSWLVAEVDYGRLKATGITVTVDGGGLPDLGGVLNPQMQDPNDPANFYGDVYSRTEVGPVLTQAFQGFLGQTSVLEFGKATYLPGENGGISGIVFYATTRAEDDPRWAAAEEWEPGIPRVQVNLYEGDLQGGIVDLDGDGGPTPADVDNYPFGWLNGGPKGPEDIDRDNPVHDPNAIFHPGDAIQITTTDSWDDNPPTGCPGADPTDPVYATDPTKCYDGLRCWNQVRPGVFDGGYAFDSYFPGGMANNDVEASPLAAPVIYVVEAVPPPGYEIIKEEDRNVDFGDTYTPSLLQTPPVCVGMDHLVPPYMSFQTDEGGNPLPGIPTEDLIEAPYANQTRRLCDLKQVWLSDQQNAAADFFMFTDVPIAGHIKGFILDDTANEFDPNAPTFGEKYAPPWIPVSIRDFSGREISKVYSDEWGNYNALVPSTSTANLPIPSGMSPNMLTVCLNDPMMPNPDYNPSNPLSQEFITDPYFNPQYSQFCYTFQYMPGTTTYLDTPVVPTAAFAGADQNPLDCEFPDQTPKISFVSRRTGGPYAIPGNVVRIVSEGRVWVPNPAYEGPGGIEPRLIRRDYRFGGTPGVVTIGDLPLEIVSWRQRVIRARVPAGTPAGAYQLTVTRGDNGKSSLVGVTLTVGPLGPGRHITRVRPSTDPSATPITDAINAASPGDLILVRRGVYPELVIMSKPVQLQGYGPGAVTINAVKEPAEKLQIWRERIESLITLNPEYLLPGQELGFGGPEPDTLFTEEGPGIMVLARDGDFQASPNARIDGFTILGADFGGGIFVNGYARYLQISNNRVVNNQGYFGGGIRLGHATLAAEGPGGPVHQSAYNNNITVRNNHITRNGGLAGAGGGLSICTGSDNYEVLSNFVCGNFTLGEGGGIAHFGLSENGLIEDNLIAFNESFNQGQTVSGGGLFIGGKAPLGTEALSEGTGSVQVISNQIQGNLAGAGDGGGIRTLRVNGRDVSQNPDQPELWHRLDLFNNIIVNNVAALAGGGISLQDAANVRIVNCTVAHNDSAATASEAFLNNPTLSNQQPAGIVSRAHSPQLSGAIGTVPAQFAADFSNPQLMNSIIWENRSFYWYLDATTTPPTFGLEATVPPYWDLGILGAAGTPSLNPLYCILTDATGYDGSNSAADPLFINDTFNGQRNQTIVIPEPTTALQAAPAFDEGGNFISLRFGPLTLADTLTNLPFDYHIGGGSGALDAGDSAIVAGHAGLQQDFDDEARPSGPGVDIGADELP